MADDFFLDIRNFSNIDTKLKDLGKAINGEQPLPCALLCAAYLDKCLKTLLEFVLVKGKTATDIMKDEAGLLGSLFSRSRLLYLMGIIDKHLVQNIQTIGRIRNMFAHSDELLTFDSPQIVELCKTLTERKPATRVSNLTKDQKRFLKAMNKRPREKFVSLSISSIIELIHISGNLRTQRQKEAMKTQ